MEILLIILILLCLYVIMKYFNQENFAIPSQFGCQNCGDFTFDQCMNCVNCGFCIDQRGYGKCVPGNINGPMFESDCVQWIYGNNILAYPLGYNMIYPHSVGHWRGNGDIRGNRYRHRRRRW